MDNEIDDKFDEEWKNGTMPGWEEEIKKARAETTDDRLY
jgi:hypothetical protein